MTELNLIAQCLERGWPDDFDIVGEDIVRKIAEDALHERGYQFESPSGGYSFELGSHLQELFAAASIFVGLLQLYYQIRAERNENIQEDKLAETLTKRAKVKFKRETLSVKFAKLLIEVKRESTDVNE